MCLNRVAVACNVQPLLSSLPELPFTLETPLECAIVGDPEWMKGAAWKQSCAESTAKDHIQQILEVIDQLWGQSEDRSRLRLIALIHDAFKHKSACPPPGSEQRTHGHWARQFAERFIADEGVLTVLALYDGSFQAMLWKTLHENREAAQQGARALIARLGPHLDLFMQFYACDSHTGADSTAHYQWFQSENRIARLAKRLNS